MTQCIRMNLISITCSSSTGAKLVLLKTREMQLSEKANPTKKWAISPIENSIVTVSKNTQECAIRLTIVSMCMQGKADMRISRCKEIKWATCITVAARHSIDHLTKGRLQMLSLKFSLSIHSPLKSDPKFIYITPTHNLKHTRLPLNLKKTHTFPHPDPKLLASPRRIII